VLDGDITAFLTESLKAGL